MVARPTSPQRYTSTSGSEPMEVMSRWVRNLLEARMPLLRLQCLLRTKSMTRAFGGASQPRSTGLQKRLANRRMAAGCKAQLPGIKAASFPAIAVLLRSQGCPPVNYEMAMMVRLERDSPHEEEPA